MARTVSVGVDIDALVHYHRIHGLPEGRASNAAWRDALPRFSEMFEALGVKATFYAVAADLAIPGNADRLRALVAQGHEIGNHTLNHRYDLTRMTADERVVEVGQGRYRLEHAAEALKQPLLHRPQESEPAANRVGMAIAEVVIARAEKAEQGQPRRRGVRSDAADVCGRRAGKPREAPATVWQLRP